MRSYVKSFSMLITCSMLWRDRNKDLSEGTIGWLTLRVVSDELWRKKNAIISKLEGIVQHLKVMLKRRVTGVDNITYSIVYIYLKLLLVIFVSLEEDVVWASARSEEEVDVLLFRAFLTVSSNHITNWNVSWIRGTILGSLFHQHGF